MRLAANVTVLASMALLLAAPPANATPCPDVAAVFARGTGEPPGVGIIGQAFLDALRSYLERRQLEIDWDTADAAPQEALVNSLSMALPFEPAEKQALLEAMDLDDRSESLKALLRIDAAEPGDGDTPASMQ